MITPEQRLLLKDNQPAAPSLDPKSLEEIEVLDRGTHNPIQEPTVAFAATGRDEETAGDGPQGVGKERSEEEEAEGVLSPNSECISEKRAELVWFLIASSHHFQKSRSQREGQEQKPRQLQKRSQKQARLRRQIHPDRQARYLRLKAEPLADLRLEQVQGTMALIAVLAQSQAI